MNKELEQLEFYKIKLKNNIEDIIKKLKDVEDNIEIYIKLFRNLLKIKIYKL